MSIPTIQVRSIVLPSLTPFGTETENINDLLEHTSRDIEVEYLQDKIIHVIAIEAITAGVPGNLWVWVELSPFPTTTSADYWMAIGGGGGALVPVAPLVEVATGADTTIHTFTLPWAIHSPYARVVVQTPVSATPLTANWVVQCWFSGKGP